VCDLLTLPAAGAVAVGQSEEDMTSTDERDEDRTRISALQEKTRAVLRSIVEQYRDGILCVLSPPPPQAKPLSQVPSSQHSLSQSMLGQGDEVECLRLLDMCVAW